MDWQALINVGGTAGLTLIAFLWKRAETRHDDLRDSLYGFKLEVAKEYVTHADLREVKEALIRIEAKLGK